MLIAECGVLMRVKKVERVDLHVGEGLYKQQMSTSIMNYIVGN